MPKEATVELEPRPKSATQQYREALATTATTLISQSHPHIQGRVRVKVKFGSNFHFKVRKAPGGVTITLYLNYLHQLAPTFSELVAKAGYAAVDILSTSTHAVAVESESHE